MLVKANINEVQSKSKVKLSSVTSDASFQDERTSITKVNVRNYNCLIQIMRNVQKVVHNLKLDKRSKIPCENVKQIFTQWLV